MCYVYACCALSSLCLTPRCCVRQFVRPLYREMFKRESAKAVAVATFTKYQDTYHPVAKKMLATDLGLRASA